MTDPPATPQSIAGLRATLDNLLGEFDRVRRESTRVREELGRVDGRAESAGGLVKVTVGPRGTLTALEISPRAYAKMSPSVLAAEIVTLAGRAGAAATARAGAVLGPLLPPGRTVEDLATGAIDPAELVAPQALSGSAAAQWWARLGISPDRSEPPHRTGPATRGEQPRRDRP
jgi:DNA-binding protein YbaB